MRPTGKFGFWLAIDNEKPIDSGVEQHIIGLVHPERTCRGPVVCLCSQIEVPPSFNNALVTFACTFCAGKVDKTG